MSFPSFHFSSHHMWTLNSFTAGEYRIIIEAQEEHTLPDVLYVRVSPDGPTYTLDALHEEPEEYYPRTTWEAVIQIPNLPDLHLVVKVDAGDIYWTVKCCFNNGYRNVQGFKDYYKKVNFNSVSIFK